MCSMETNNLNPKPGVQEYVCVCSPASNWMVYEAGVHVHVHAIVYVKRFAT